MESVPVPKDLTFINVFRPHQDQQTKELQHSEVRAHTARHYHRKRRDEVEQEKATHDREEKNICRYGNSECDGICLLKPAFCIACPEEVGECSLGIHMPATIKTYLLLFAPNVNTICNVFGFPNIWTAELLPYASRGHCFAAISAIMQSAHDFVTSRITTWTKEPSSKVLKFKARAIEELRRDLEDTGSADDTCLLSVLFLAVLANRVGDKTQRDVHRKALAFFVKNRGGLEKVDGFVRCWLEQFEAFWAMETGVEVIKRAKVGMKDDGGGRVSSKKDIGRLPSGFRSLIKTATISTEVVHALVRTQESLQQKRKPSAAKLASSSSNEANLVGDPQADLWATISHLSRPTLVSTEPEISKLLHLGLLLFNYLAFSNLEIWYIMSLWTNLAHWIRRELTRGLLMCLIPRKVGEERCLCWLTGVAVGSWRLGRENRGVGVGLGAGDEVLSEEGRMLVGWGRVRFAEVLKNGGVDGASGAGKGGGKEKAQRKAVRAGDWFDCERVCFDIGSVGRKEGRGVDK